MDQTRFDRLTRFMARGTSRRVAIKTMAASAAGAAGSAAFVATTKRASAAATGPGEEWMQLYEAMAASVDKVTDNCDSVVAALNDWHDQNAAKIAQMQADILTWTPEDIKAHQTAYSGRVQDAAIAIHLSLSRCGFLENSDSPLALADVNATFTPATPEASAGVRAFVSALPAATINEGPCVGPNDNCNCDCTPGNVFTVGNCILWAAACAFGGCASPPNCCWSGICVAGFDFDHCVAQCMNCDNIQPHC
jgi:hypothetical protein